MPGGGVLTVSARNELLNGKNSFSLPPGPYLRLTFIDQGCGIPTDDLKKIFDPYFTTKSTGTGMGLSSVHSIVHRHGGHIQAASTVGKGTTFTIHLPSIGKASAHYQEETPGQSVGKHIGGSVLVMDDEEMIIDVASSILAYLGYKVTTCSNGEETIDHYKASMDSDTPFLAVIMDLTIPGGVGGKEAAERILSQFPNACLIVSSGYSNDPIMSNYRDYGFSGAIAKPYNIQKFKEVLSCAIGNARVG
jgi:CheY-like chemotaxis protein